MRTKIVCTIGPAVENLETMIALIEAGMRVARLNFSHGTHEEHARRIADLKEARRRTGKPVAIMLDTKGPELRVGPIEPIELKRGQVVRLGVDIPVEPVSVLADLKKGMTVLFDDGYIASTVVDVIPEGLLIEIIDGGTLKSRKGINIPGVDLNIPLVTEKDKEDIRFGCAQDVDLIAASFVCNAEQILEIRDLLDQQSATATQVLAKIETRQGIENIDSILQVSDGVMVARGDLGVEVPLADVPILQKMLIRKCYEVGKPSIVATQMLESMIHNPRPTRAEASDVANAIYDSGSAVMLSGETAVGEYPIETVKQMGKIIERAEQEFDYAHFLQTVGQRPYHGVAASVALAAVRTAVNSNARAIFCITSSGKTVRLLSSFRPSIPILALTTSEKVSHQLAFNWGVVPIHCNEVSSTEEGFEIISKWAQENGYVRQGDLVIITAGIPFGVAGTTNMMQVESIGDVIVRGTGGYGHRASGRIRIIYETEKTTGEDLSDAIVVLTKCQERDLPVVQKAAGIVLQNHFMDPTSEQYLLVIAKALGKPVVVGADFATEILSEGEEVTIDPQDGLVYRGTPAF